MKKIFVGIPLKRYKEPECESFLVEKVFKSNQVYTVGNYSVRRGSSNIYYQRYNLAQDFLKSDCDYYLYIDGDQAVTTPDNPIELMIEARKNIISPLIVRTIYPHIPACMTFQMKKKQDKKEKYLEDFRRFSQDKPYEVYFSCGGLVLIERKVVDFIKNPFWPVFNNGILMGTDWGFYHEARKKGFRCWIDPRVHCVHIAPYPFHPDNYHALLDTGELENLEYTRENV